MALVDDARTRAAFEYLVLYTVAATRQEKKTTFAACRCAQPCQDERGKSEGVGIDKWVWPVRIFYVQSSGVGELGRAEVPETYI